MTNDQIAKAEAKLAKREAQIRKAKDAAKIQKRKLEKLKRDARTHQLCERGGELNHLLQRPDDLTDEQVKQFLQDVFSLPIVQEKLAAILPPNPAEEVAQELESEQQDSQRSPHQSHKPNRRPRGTENDLPAHHIRRVTPSEAGKAENTDSCGDTPHPI